MNLKAKKVILMTGICVLALGSYSLSSFADTTTETNTTQEQPPKDPGIMGKITGVDGRTITVVLADAPSNDGTTPPEKPDENSTPPETTDATATPPEKPANDGTASDNGEKPEMAFNGETKTYTIPTSATITKGMERESATVSDLSADSVIRITLDGDTVTEVNIM